MPVRGHRVLRGPHHDGQDRLGHGPGQAKARTHPVPSPRPAVQTGSAVLLRGGGYSPDFGLGAPNDVRWSSGIDGPLGRGFEALARVLSAGTHEIRLEVPDGLGGTSTAVTSVSVAESPRSE